MTNTNTMEIGKTYTQSWVIGGSCQRSHSFTVEAFAKNGSAKGSLVDADGKRYSRFFVKPGEFAKWAAK